MAGNRKYQNADNSAEEYEYYDAEYEENEDEYDDYDDEYDDYEDFEDDEYEDEEYEVDANEYYYDDEEDEDDDALEMEAMLDDDEYYFDDDEYYEDRPGIGKRFLQRVSRPTQVFIISLFLVIAAFAMGWKYIDNTYFQPVDKSDRAMQEINIERGISTSKIAEMLVEKGIIRDKNVFKLYIDINDKSSKIKAGIYKLSPAMTIPEVVDALSLGAHASNESQFRFIEGKSVADLLNVLKDKNLMTNETEYMDLVTKGTGVDDYYFVKELIDPTSDDIPVEGEDQAADEDQATVTVSTEDVYTYEEIPRIPGERKYMLEGYMFPDTYIVYSNSSPKEIAKKMLNQFNNKFTDTYVERAERMGMTVDDVITLASIIEREGTEKDFKKISAVFHNRLRKGEKLESCATAQYFLNTSRLVLSEDEEKQENPYNTYVAAGLPAGPICNPGAEAIKAALYPDESLMEKNKEYMFFCLTDPQTKEQEFTQTLDQHLKVRDQWKPVWQEYDDKYAN